MKRRCAQEDDVLGPAIYLSKHRGGAEFYGEGRGGKTLGPFYVRGNIVGPDTEVPYSFNPDGSVKKRAKAIHVLGWLRGQLTMGKREPGGEGMSPAEYARWFWKRRGVDGYAIEGGLEVAIYDPKNIRHAEAFDGQGAGSLGAPGEREDTGRGGTDGEGGHPPDPEARNMDHFCVQVEPWDADAILGHLEHKGVAAGEAVVRYGALGDGPSIYIADPEGNTIELKGPPRVS